MYLNELMMIFFLFSSPEKARSWWGDRTSLERVLLILLIVVVLLAIALVILAAVTGSKSKGKVMYIFIVKVC